MKTAFYALVILVVGAGMIWVVRSHRSGAEKASTTTIIRHIPHAVNTAANYPPPTPSAQDPRAVSPSEWGHLRDARDAAMKANPDLAAEYKELLKEMKAQQAKFDAAMIAADPKVAPIVTKFLAMRDRSMASNPALTPGSK